MKKSDWKVRTQAAERLVSTQAATIRGLREEVEEMRRNWQPRPIAHEYRPRDAGCMFCDFPADDPRHRPAAS